MTAAAATSGPSSSVPAPAAAPAEPFAQPAGEACPLCGAPLDPQQDWCLHCGAAARTRLAATPNWKAPIAAIAVVAALALGVLAAALVKLVGGSESSGSTVTTTIATAPTASLSTTTPAATLPSATSTTATVPPTTTATTSTPTVKAQPKDAGGIVSPPSAPTATAKGKVEKALKHLTPKQRSEVEKLIHPGSSGR